jgi:FkbM family methyltransferase
LFEINPVFFVKLKKKLSLFNNTEKIIVNNIGIGDRAGFLDYCEKTQSLVKRQSDESKNLIKLKKLPIITLHSYLKKNKIKRIDFLKTDIECYDYFALLGLKSYLKKTKFIQFELGLGAKLNLRGGKKYLQYRYVGIENYFNILKKDFVLYILRDENNPIWKKSNLKNKDLLLFNKKDISNIIKFTKVGIGFNIFAISKKINISILGLSISRDKVPNFNEFKYLN